MNKIFPTVELKLEDTHNLSELFKNNFKEIWLEVGFGSGEHLKWQLKKNKDIAIIGCEPYLNGIANLLAILDEDELKRVRIFNGDAIKVINNLKDKSISKVFVLFPDPWPKKKHYKRRLIQINFIENIYRVLIENGELRLSTDHNNYLCWILNKFLKFNKFHWNAKSKLDFLNKPEKWIKTKYEIRANKLGNTCFYLQYYKPNKNN